MSFPTSPISGLGDFSFGRNLDLKPQWSGLGFIMMLLWFQVILGECLRPNYDFFIFYDRDLVKESIVLRIMEIGLDLGTELWSITSPKLNIHFDKCSMGDKLHLGIFILFDKRLLFFITFHIINSNIK